ncbi:hypothetical protein CLU83_0786 [Flavobacterium sp. 1]|uniref:hypothetical protein n=1 Tax=Flavobacterium sp. 1 TaxID=2035200 RepID=UPI000C24B5C3|nr:hypothetical protein [Flavobacterium sp. 1]PJJ07600.1 hypothetical protein CLU83_0786 [Flavobacterium sp. 1]
MKNCITFLLLLICYCSYGQTYETLKNVKLPKNLKLTKKVTVSCPQELKKGQTIINETEFKHTVDGKSTTKTIISEEVITENTTTLVDKEVTIKVNSIENAKANIYVDEKDNSIIHVNYWLNPTNTILKDTNIKFITNTYNCDGTTTRNVPKTITKLDSDKKYMLYKYEKQTLGNEDYLTHCDTIIEVYKNDGTSVDYYLINKYDRKTDYTFQLANRETIYLKNSSIVFGPLTIPIKYRFDFEKNDIKINEDFTADLNVGIFGGWTFGKQKVNYQRGVGFKDNFNVWSITIGPFFNVGTTTLSKSNTTLGKTPITSDATQNIGVVSTGIGFVKSVYNFQFGLFYGWDFGAGKDSNNWNYDGKPWFGFGIGYSLTGFWKK